MKRTASLVLVALAAVFGLALMPAALSAQKALVYCPVAIDVSGCNAVVNALGGAFPDGVDRGYNGTEGTVDLATADLWQYSVFVVPSLADDASKQPYALLRDAAAAKTSGVGSYAITAALNDPNQRLGNYDVSNTPGTLTVRKAALVVAAADQSREYGDANPVFTGSLTGVQNNDAIRGSYGSSATPASPAGEYPITANAEGDAAVLANYEMSATPGTLTVTQATLTVAPASASKTYGQAASLGGSITGQKNRDEFSATYASDGAAANAPVGTGSYPITVATVDAAGGAKLTNYTVDRKTAVLTVSKAPLTVAAAAKSKVYDGQPFTDFTVRYAGFVLGQDASVLTGTLAFTGTAVGEKNAGSYVITPGGLSSGNYAIRFVPGTLGIRYAANSYRFLQPINKHPEETMSAFKYGSTIPVKFQLFNAAGQPVQTSDGKLPVISVRRISLVDANEPVTAEDVISTVADQGTSFRWDGQQYIFNLNTKNWSVNYRYEITATSDGVSKIVTQVTTKK